jgi:hypothetical protein
MHQEIDAEWIEPHLLDQHCVGVAQPFQGNGTEIFAYERYFTNKKDSQ